jgi:hypothetical protein
MKGQQPSLPPPRKRTFRSWTEAVSIRSLSLRSTSYRRPHPRRIPARLGKDRVRCEHGRHWHWRPDDSDWPCGRGGKDLRRHHAEPLAGLNHEWLHGRSDSTDELRMWIEKNQGAWTDQAGKWFTETIQDGKDFVASLQSVVDWLNKITAWENGDHWTLFPKGYLEQKFNPNNILKNAPIQPIDPNALPSDLQQKRDQMEKLNPGGLIHKSAFMVGSEGGGGLHITNPKSAPLELQATVPEIMVPFRPIIEEGQEPFAMLRDLWINHPDRFFRPLYYSSVDALIASLDEKIIRPAEARFVELLKRKAETMGGEHI